MPNVNGSSSRERTFLPSFWGETSEGWEKGTFTLGRYVHVPARDRPAVPGGRACRTGSRSSRWLTDRLQDGTGQDGTGEVIISRTLSRPTASGAVRIGVIPRFCGAGRAARKAKSAWGDPFAGRSGTRRTPGQRLEPISSRK